MNLKRDIYFIHHLILLILSHFFRFTGSFFVSFYFDGTVHHGFSRLQKSHSDIECFFNYVDQMLLFDFFFARTVSEVKPLLEEGLFYLIIAMLLSYWPNIIYCDWSANHLSILNSLGFFLFFKQNLRPVKFLLFFGVHPL